MFTPNSSRQPADRDIVRIIPPVSTDVDVLAIQRLVRQIHTIAGSDTISLEIAQEPLATQFLITAPRHQMPSLLSLIRQTYPQAQTETVSPNDDPARRRPGVERIAVAEMALSGPSELPLHILEPQARRNPGEVDTIPSLMSLAGTLEPGERVVSQLLLRSIPGQWSGIATTAPDRVQKNNQITSINRAGCLMALAAGEFLFLLLGGLAVFTGNRQGLWLIGFAIALLLPITLAWYLVGKSNHPLDPELTLPKVRQVGFEFALRLIAYAPLRQRAEALAHAVYAAYGQFNQAGGNSLVGYLYHPDADLTQRRIQDVKLPPWPWTDLEMFLHPRLLDIWPRQPRGILVPSEIAGLWHLPMQVLPSMHAEPRLYKHLTPPERLTRAGHLIGKYEHQGQAMKVYLPREALNSHCLILGKSQRGKSALMARLASALLSDLERALIVIDPHNDLAQAIAAAIPPDQSERVLVWNLTDTDYPIGLNIIEPSDRRSDDKVISDVVSTMERLWRDWWGARLEDVLRWSARSLIQASRYGPHVYTLLDVNRFLSDAAFRRLVLRSVNDPDARRGDGQARCD